MDERPSCLWRPIEVLSALLLAFMSACTGAQTTPDDWVESGTHPAYTDSRYLVGVGWGDTMDVADDRARGEIAKFFNARVVTVTREEERYTHTGGLDGEDARFFESITRARVRGDAVFEDAVLIAERTLRRGTHYSLAVLDKRAVRSRLERELSEVEMELEERLSTQGAPEVRVRSLARALSLFQRKASLARQLRLVGPSVAVDWERVDRTVVALRDLLTAHFPIVVICADDELRKDLTAALTDASLVIVDSGGQSIEVAANLSLDETSQNGLFQVHYVVSLQATDGATVLAEARAQERLTHPDAALGEAKVRVEIKQRVIRPFVEDVREAILGKE